jgi:hypothetical protein
MKAQILALCTNPEAIQWIVQRVGLEIAAKWLISFAQIVMLI